MTVVSQDTVNAFILKFNPSVPRLEQERKRQAELDKQLEKQRQLEHEREEQRRKLMEQKEVQWYPRN